MLYQNCVRLYSVSENHQYVVTARVTLNYAAESGGSVTPNVWLDNRLTEHVQLDFCSFCL
jgi:hypothetical protein